MNRLLAVACLLPALLSTPLTAQEAGAPTSSVPVRESILDLGFAGGTLPELARQVEGKVPGINIVLGEGADRVRVPPLKLRDVEVEDVWNTAALVVNQEDFSISVKTIRSRGASPIYTILVRERRQSAAQQASGVRPARPEPEVAVFSLRLLTTPLPGESTDRPLHLKPETVLSAVEKGLNMGESATEPALRFHADSGLLFIRGSNEQIGLVTMVLHRMEQDLKALRASAPPRLLPVEQPKTEGQQAR